MYEPDSATIDAWLAGTLPEDEVAEVERFFDAVETPPPAGGEGGGIPSNLLGALPDTGTRPEVAQLVELVKTGHGQVSPAPVGDEWREVLEPSAEAGLLGTLGGYEVIEPIAIGGMGIVLKARDPELDRLVAIKVLSPKLATNATARERFLREARAAAALEHANILPIYGVHDEGAVPYFAMRYADGGTLQDALDRGERFDLERLLAIARGVAGALEAAHANGIVHRDIKPANILFGKSDADEVWVCDFGIARSAEDPALTYAGAIAGTPQFMSPEQAAGGELDGRSDLFSLGSVLYRCASGEQAFSGATTAAVLREVAAGGGSLAAGACPALPPWFRRLLESLLAKDPRDRPPDAGAVVRAIDERHAPRPRRRARRNRRIAAAVTSAAIIMLASHFLLQVPAVIERVNGVLAGRHEQAFFIEGKLGAYGSLADAVEAAPDGGAVLLPAGGTVFVDGVRIPANKTLELKPAAPDGRVEVTVRKEGARGIVVDGVLRTERLDFALKPKAGSPGVLVVSGTASARAHDCTFSGRREASRFDDIKAHAIDLDGGASLELRRCRFDLENANAITVLDERLAAGEPTRIAISDTGIECFYGIALSRIAVAEPGLEVEAEGLDFSGECLLNRTLGDATPSMFLRVSHSVLRPRHALIWLRMREPAIARSRLRWEGEGNRYPGRPGEVRFAMGPQDEHTMKVQPVAEFSAAAADRNEAQVPSDPGDWVEIEASGVRYPTLEEAFAKAAPGSTLLLSGEHRCDTVLRGADLRLLAAEKASPVDVVAGNPNEAAIHLTGECEVFGIRFARSGGTPSSPVVVLCGGDGATDVNFRFCWFQTAAGAGGPGVGVVGADAATFSHCFFQTLAAAGVDVDLAARDGGRSVLRLRSCAFVGPAAIGSTAGRHRSAELDVMAERCVVASDFLWDRRGGGALSAVDFEVRFSVVAPSGAMFRLAEISGEDVAARLVWRGVKNVYLSGMTALVATRDPGADGAEDFRVPSLEALHEAVAGYSEIGSKRTTRSMPAMRMRVRMTASNPSSAARRSMTCGSASQ